VITARTSPSPRIICFDVGGVLVRIHRSWPEVCRAVGLESRGNWTGEANALAYQTMMDLLGTGQISEQEWSERLSIAVAGSYTPAELVRILHGWTLGEYPGIGALVDELHAHSVETACLSNTTHGHWIRLLHEQDGQPLAGAPTFPGVKRLRHHFASHLLGLAKPDPAIYRAFEAATGRAGADILFFDDLLPNVTAARDLGWRAELIDPERETAPQIRRHLTRHGIL
jgi:putative hydrolase of the HAD superfamily